METFFYSCCNSLEALSDSLFVKAELVRGRAGFSSLHPFSCTWDQQERSPWPSQLPRLLPVSYCLLAPVAWQRAWEPEHLMASFEGCIQCIKMGGFLACLFSNPFIKRCISGGAKVSWHFSQVPEDWLRNDGQGGTSGMPKCRVLQLPFTKLANAFYPCSYEKVVSKPCFQMVKKWSLNC